MTEFAGYVTFAPMGDPVQAEHLTSWPSSCVICLREHGRTVMTRSAKRAVKHRIKKHRWLHDILVANGSVPA